MVIEEEGEVGGRARPSWRVVIQLTRSFPIVHHSPGIRRGLATEQVIPVSQWVIKHPASDLVVGGVFN